MFAHTLFLLAGLSALATLADELPAQRGLSLYDASPSAGAPEARRRADERARIWRLQSGTFGNADDYDLKGHVVFKSVKRPIVSDSRDLVVAPGALPAAWRADRGQYVWYGTAAEQAPAVLPIAPQDPAKRFEPAEFQNVWIDYEVFPGMASCTPQLEMQLVRRGAAAGDKGARLVAQSAGVSNPKVLFSIDAANAGWREKGAVYLAGRLMGLAPDDDWRYSQDGPNGVLQRRMHTPVNDVELLDIALAPGTRVQQVNVRVAAGDSRRGGELIQFSGFPDKLILPDGRAGLRIDLRSALAQRFPAEWAQAAQDPRAGRLHLQEIFVFIPGDGGALAAGRAVRSIELLGEAAGAEAPPVRLGSVVSDIGQSRRRLNVEVRSLGERSELDFASGALRLFPPPGATSCALRLEGIHAVTAYGEDLLPVFAAQLEEWSRRWGGPFSVVSPAHAEIEDPGIAAYVPFAAVTQPDLPPDAATEMLLKIGANNQVQAQALPAVAPAAPYRVVTAGREMRAERSRLLSSTGITISSEGKPPAASVEGDLLVLGEGSGALNIAWPITAKIDAQTRFYLAVADGADAIDSITLTLDLGAGGTLRRRVLPNRAMPLLANAGEVRQAMVRIVPSRSPYRLKLREMALFQPRAATIAQAFTTPVPAPYTHVPEPRIGNEAKAPLVETQAGQVAGVSSALDGDPLRFSTPLDPPLEWLRGIRLGYRLPASSADPGVCALALQLNWARGRTEHRLCLSKSEGTFFLPVASLVDAKDARDLGALKSIDWMVQPPVRMESTAIEIFNVRFSVEGTALVSAADQLRLSRLFDDDPVNALAERSDKQAAFALPVPAVWLPFAKPVAAKMLQSGAVAPPDQPLFGIDQVVAQPRQPLAAERWLELDKPAPALSAPPSWPRWAAIGIVVLLAVAAWKLLPWMFARLRSPARRGFVLLGSGLRGGARRLSPLGRAVRARRDAALPLAALAGIWLAGRQGMIHAGVMLLIASGMLAYLAYAERTDGVPAPSARVRSRAWLLALGAACAIWSVGQYRFAGEALWGLLPLLVASLAWTPPLERFSAFGARHARHLRHAPALSALVLAFVFYWAGARSKPGGAENYYFTFGALAAAFALPWLLRTLEPAWRKRFPGLVMGGGGRPYFVCAMAVLAALALALVLGMGFLAEQLAVVVYFLLIAGVLVQAWVASGTNTKSGPNAA